MNPFRGWQYYFTAPGLLSGSKESEDEDEEGKSRRRQFEDVAVTGEHMLNWASVQPWVSTLSFTKMSTGLMLIKCNSPAATSPGA